MIAVRRTGRAVRLATVAGLVAAVVTAAAPAVRAVDVPTFPGSLADAASAVTVIGRGHASDLAVRVNQTKDLTTQGVSLSWTWRDHDTVRGYATDGSGAGTVSDSATAQVYLGNYLQIMQCWGDAVTAASVAAAPADQKAAAQADYVEGNEGPPREQCFFGGTAQNGNIPGVVSAIQGSRSAGGAAAAGAKTVYYGDETVYPTTPNTYTGAYPEVPFRSVDGVETRTSFVKPATGGRTWANNYFGRNTSNEVPAAPVTNGTGGTTFQMYNSLDAGGLGCGAVNAAKTGLNKCWLVLVPRTLSTTVGNDTATFNPKRPAVSGVGTARTVVSGPLASTLWADRIAIPMDFRPTLDACSTSTKTYQTVGSELPQNALLSWQAALCAGGSDVGYTYTTTPDSVARQALQSGSDRMRLVSDPVAPGDVFDPVTYAPITLSGVTVSFVFEPAQTGFSPPVTSIQLNQRLVAKLLTQSYQDANPWRLNKVGAGDPAPEKYAWLAKNPANVWLDPEFQALNPEVAKAIQAAEDEVGTDTWNAGPGANGYLQVNGNGSDAYTAVWKWLLADKDTVAFLAGNPDSNGMVVDPYYSTDAARNPGGAAFDPTAYDYFPSLDQWQGQPFGYVSLCQYSQASPDGKLPLVGTVDLDPPTTTLNALARNVVRVDSLNKASTYNCQNPDGSTFPNADQPRGWRGGYTAPLPGQRRMLALTDTASSAQYGVVTANLRNAAGKYVGADTASMQAAASHLVYTGGVEGVGQPDPATTDPAAYPLSLLTYAAVQTNKLTSDACAAYANLLTYASTDGQVAGAEVGKLPFGYAPLPDTLKQQTATAARTVATCAKLPDDSAPDQAADAPADTSGGTTDTGGGDVSPPTDAGVTALSDAAPTTQQPGVSLAATRGTTKPDLSVFAWIVPAALLLGLLSLLVAPVAGLRRRSSGPSAPGGAD